MKKNMSYIYEMDTVIKTPFLARNFIVSDKLFPLISTYKG
jgi:hypothetical protein